MTTPDDGKERLHCVVPGCGRTAPANKHPGSTEIICRRHWKMVPDELKNQYKRLNAKERQLKRMYAKRGVDNPQLNTLWRLRHQNWKAIRASFASDKPEGIDAFMKEAGLR